MGGRRMNTLSECARHSALIEVTCRRCGRSAYFAPDALKHWMGLGDCTPDIVPFRCSVCGSRAFRCCPALGVSRTAATSLPSRPPRDHDDEALPGL
jgi:ribosomal protein L37E